MADYKSEILLRSDLKLQETYEITLVFIWGETSENLKT